MQILLTIIGTLLYLAGFVIFLKSAYNAENDNNVWWERDYIGCWIMAIVWPLSLAVLLIMFSFSFVHEKLRGG